MFKTLIFGILLGIVGTIAAVYYLPVVDQHREASIIAVAPNGGNTEAFYMNIPMDRIMVGAPNQAEPLPPGMDWPIGEAFSGLHAELFKVRNAEETVIGVASRVATESEKFGDSIEWVVHLPARGTFYVAMPPESVDGVRRVGTLQSGTREFGPMHGNVSERWVANTDDDDEDAPDGRIELITMFVGEFADDIPEETS
jgi:hypothetical protein